MKLRKLAIVGGLIVASIQLSACGGPAIAAPGSKPLPGYTEKIEGSELNRVILVQKAAERLNIQTAEVREAQVNGKQHQVIPYAAVIYGNHGETWMYTNSEPLKFVRLAITVDHIDGDTAVLVDGPATGTKIVTVGVAELYGIDTGVK